ncbi:MAG: EcoAI/FtnUII family type I restriction enzme subunit R [Ardenticatenaceae bacterium]
MNKKQLSEQEIRTRYITPALREAGWQQMQIREEYYFTDGRMNVQPNGKAVRGRRHFVDYLLVYNNVMLAIVEAKENKQLLGAGMQQGLRYAEALDVPFVYSSNGDGFLEHDRLASYGVVERVLGLDEFPAPDALWERYSRAKHFSSEQQAVVTPDYYFERGGKRPRYYQRVAIQRVVTAVAQGQQRILLVMATGAGKTYTAFQIVWRLRKAGRVNRVLFLADRNALIDQTKTGDFKHFEPIMTKVRQRQVDKSYQIYLALYQAVSGTEERQNIYKLFSPDFFDLIVIDECHRGSAAAESAWREILTYFASAIHLGLTATPKETDKVSNIDYFGDPVYTYSLKQGIEDGFLAPYKVIRINVDKDVDGWMPKAGQRDKHGNLIEEREYSLKDWDKTVVLEQRNELVAQRTAEYLASLAPYAKTIVFCVDIAHAERMRRFLVNAIGAEAASERRYVMRITGDHDEGKAALDDFIDPAERYPVIATTSKLMTTGVDAQTCKVIVLDSVINSMTEFKQIVGRGTRLRPDLGKTYFTVLDFRHATRLFLDPTFDGDPIQAEEYDGSQDMSLEWDPLEAQEEAPGDDQAGAGHIKYYLDDVPVRIIAERVEYYAANGQLISKSFIDFSRENVQKHYQTRDAFLQRWHRVPRKAELLLEFMQQGVMLDELAAQVGDEYDPFDLICHVAFDQPLLTRQERAHKVKQHDLYTTSRPAAQRVLDVLLEKYTQEGISVIEQAADRKQAPQMLRVKPFEQLGTPQQIVRAFGGIKKYMTSVQKIKQLLYQVQ